MFVFLIIAGLEAMEEALELEKKVNKNLLDLHQVADSHGDFQVRKTPDQHIFVYSNLSLPDK